MQVVSGVAMINGTGAITKVTTFNEQHLLLMMLNDNRRRILWSHQTKDTYFLEEREILL